MDVKRIGATLKRTREQRGLTQDGLAAAARMSRATVAAIEGARYQSIQLATLDQLATALGIGLADLLGQASKLRRRTA